MPPAVNTLGMTGYEVAGPGMGNGTIHRAEHHVYTTAEARITLAVNAHPANVAMRRLGGVRAVAGDAIFLQFFANKITSVRLPVPPPAGVNFFFTDNMSGCKFFVDTINGGNDLVVYHANTTQHGPAPGVNSDIQDPLAVAALDTQHTNAQGDYGLVLNNVATLEKSEYFEAAGDAERRKRGQGRVSTHDPLLGPSFVGGCTIVGYPVGNSWDFYYQTWGDLEYARPTGAGYVAKKIFTFHWNYIHKRVWSGTQHNTGYAEMSVIDHDQFY